MTGEVETCFGVFAALKAQRKNTLAELERWPAARLRFCPAPGAWSAVEVLDHIVRAETGTTAEARLGLQNPRQLGIEDRPGIAALDRALRSEQRFQVPPGAETIHPDTVATMPEVSARWELARRELGRLLEQLAPDNACCGVFCHPFAGWMTVREVLDHHLAHHSFQLARLRAASAHLA